MHGSRKYFNFQKYDFLFFSFIHGDILLKLKNMKNVGISYKKLVYTFVITF
jgi:hypothetical protein